MHAFNSALAAGLDLEYYTYSYMGLALEYLGP